MRVLELVNEEALEHLGHPLYVLLEEVAMIPQPLARLEPLHVKPVIVLATLYDFLTEVDLLLILGMQLLVLLLMDLQFHRLEVDLGGEATGQAHFLLLGCRRRSCILLANLFRLVDLGCLLKTADIECLGGVGVIRLMVVDL